MAVTGLCAIEKIQVYRMGVDLTRYLLLDALCLWGVRRSGNEKLIFLLTGPPDIKLFSFQISYSCVECPE